MREPTTDISSNELLFSPFKQELFLEKNAFSEAIALTK